MSQQARGTVKDGIEYRGGSYRFRLVVEDQSGAKRRVWFSGYPTRTAAKDARKELEVQRKRGVVADLSRETLAEYIERWLTHSKTTLRPKTHLRTAGLLRRHVVPRIGGIQVSKVRPAHVQSVLDAMVTAGLKPRTINQTRAWLRAAYRSAVDWQIVSTNPVRDVRRLRTERPQLEIPSWGTVMDLMAAAEGTALYVPVVLLATTGMRRGEVLGLRWSNVDVDAGIIRVVEAAMSVGQSITFVEPKTDRSLRPIELNRSTVEILRRHNAAQASRRLKQGAEWRGAKKHEDDLVLDRGDGRPIHPDVLSRSFQRFTRRRGLSIRLHDLRHAHATELLRQGVHPKIVSERLGHSSTAFTMDAYSHLLKGMGEVAADAIERAMAGS